MYHEWHRHLPKDSSGDLDKGGTVVRVPDACEHLKNIRADVKEDLKPYVCAAFEAAQSNPAAYEQLAVYCLMYVQMAVTVNKALDTLNNDEDPENDCDMPKYGDMWCQFDEGAYKVCDVPGV